MIYKNKSRFNAKHKIDDNNDKKLKKKKNNNINKETYR